MSPLLFSGAAGQERRAKGLHRGSWRLPGASSSSCPPSPCRGYLRKLWGQGGQKGKQETSIPPNSSRIRPWAGARRVAEPKDWTENWGGWGWEWGSERQIPSPPIPSCSNPPFLPQAGAGHFVQILVNTPPPPLCRGLPRSCRSHLRFLSYYSPTFLLSPSPAACCPINLGSPPSPTLTLGSSFPALTCK